MADSKVSSYTPQPPYTHASATPSKSVNDLTCYQALGSIAAIIGLAAVILGICNLCPGAGALYHFVPPLASIGLIVGGLIFWGPIAHVQCRK